MEKWQKDKLYNFFVRHCNSFEFSICSLYFPWKAIFINILRKWKHFVHISKQRVIFMLERNNNLSVFVLVIFMKIKVSALWQASATAIIWKIVLPPYFWRHEIQTIVTSRQDWPIAEQKRIYFQIFFSFSHLKGPSKYCPLFQTALWLNHAVVSLDFWAFKCRVQSLSWKVHYATLPAAPNALSVTIRLQV